MIQFFQSDYSLTSSDGPLGPHETSQICHEVKYWASTRVTSAHLTIRAALAAFSSSDPSKEESALVPSACLLK